MVKISIVMPVYNGSDFIKRSIGSALKQTLEDIEIICVNDESTDMLEYKVCFDEPVDNSVDEPVDNRRNANEQAERD